MKRSLTAFAAAALAVLCLSGCDRMAQEQPAPTPDPKPAENQSVEPAPAPVPAPPAPAQSPEPETPVAQEPPYEMTEGVWLATTDAGHSNYYYFNPRECSGNYVNLEYGLGVPFTYEGSGDKLVFHLEGHDTEKPAVVEHTDEQTFALVWQDSLPERLSFVSEGTLEDFHFYSNHDLAQLALEHYSDSNDHTPSMTGAMTNEDNTVTVQLYDNLGDHNTTAAWYILDRFTATGTNLMTGEQVDLLDSRMDDPTEPDPETNPDSDAESEVRYDVSDPEKVTALIDLFLNDPETIENHGGEHLVDWLTNSTHGFTVLYGDPYFSFQCEWTVGWYAKAVDAGSFCPITIPEHLLNDVLAICGATI